MLTGSFADREHAVENEFFYRVDQQLIQKMREKSELKDAKDALAAASGIQDKAILDELIAVGIRADTLLAFHVYPAVYVAWCDRILDSTERADILDAAEDVGFVRGTPSYALLATWLKHRPGADLFTAWQDYVQGLSAILSPDAFRAIRSEALKRATHVAEAAGGILGIHCVSPAENAAIRELKRTF